MRIAFVSDIHGNLAALEAVAADITRRGADRVVILGGDAQVEPVPGMKASIERWDTDEPSLRGIEGDERMDLIRDDIRARVEALASELELVARP